LAKLEDNPFISLQEDFSSVYKRKKFVRGSGFYIPPREVKLPADDTGIVRTFQYIPIIDLVKAIVSDPGFCKQTEYSRESETLYDIKDGEFWKNSPYFQNNPTALGLIFYSDELEVCNPLGAAKGKQKVLNLYMTMAEIPKPMRSKTENYFLVLSIRSQDLPPLREALYQPLIADLRKLEEGVSFQNGVLKAGLLIHLGDNLEAHLVSGLSQCFSSKDVCRQCHIQVPVFNYSHHLCDR
jgi:hypothetical protein